MFKMPTRHTDSDVYGLSVTTKTWSRAMGKSLGRECVMFLCNSNIAVGPRGIFMSERSATAALIGKESIREILNLKKIPVVDLNQQTSHAWALNPTPEHLGAVWNGMTHRLVGLIFPQDMVKRFNSLERQRRILP